MNDIKNKLKTKKFSKITVTVIFIMLGIILISWDNFYSPDDQDISYNYDEVIYYSQLLENRITEFIETVDGIKKADVFITIDSSTEYEYVPKGSVDGYPIDYLIINGNDGEDAAIIKEIYPQIRGIAVSCTGGESSVIKKKVTSLLSAGLGIPSHKINVVGN